MLNLYPMDVEMSTTEEQPALTAEEWRDGVPCGWVQVERGGTTLNVWLRDTYLELDNGGDVVRVPEEHRRALAALALHDQSFGFTHDMLDALRDAVTEWQDAWIEAAESKGTYPTSNPEVFEMWGAIETALANIKTLLPPLEQQA